MLDPTLVFDKWFFRHVDLGLGITSCSLALV